MDRARVYAAGVLFAWGAACATGEDVGPGSSSSSGGASTGGASGAGASAGTGASTPDAGGGSAGTGGVGGGGGTGGSAGSTGGMGGATTMCGGQTCSEASLLGLINLPACCPTSNPSTCGLETSSVVAFEPLWPLDCVELDQPGNADSSCPMEQLSVGAMSLPLPGCCRPGGTCGWIFDLTSLGGPNVGCADSTPFLDGGSPMSCSP